MVDNASTDDTAQQAALLWKQFGTPAPLRVVHESTPGLASARVAGVHAAQHEFISFVDDDNWIDDNWIETVSNVLSNNPQVGACGGKNTAAFETTPPEWFYTVQHLFAVGEQANKAGVLPDEKYELWGAGLSIRHAAWAEMEISGFKSLLSDRAGINLSSGGDAEICFALKIMGYHLYYTPELQLKHFIPSNRLQWDYVQRLAVGFADARFTLTSYDYFYRRPTLIYKYPYLYLILYLLYNLGLLMRATLNKILAGPQSRSKAHVEWLRRLNMVRSFRWQSYRKLLAVMETQVFALKRNSAAL